MLLCRRHSNHIRCKVLGADSKFQIYVNPGMKVPAGAERIHNISGDFLAAEGFSFSEAWHQFKLWLASVAGSQKVALLAHNGRGFDFVILDEEFRRAGIEGSWLDGVHTLVDTLDLVRAIDDDIWDQVGSKPISLSMASLYENLLGGRILNAHNALGDVLALEDILESTALRMHWRKVATDVQLLVIS